MAEAHARRSYLIDRRFQLKYILLLAAWGAALAGLFGLWAWQAHLQAAEILASAPRQPALLQQADRHLLWAMGGIAALSAAAMALFGFVVTHRVAGPVWVMGNQLAELAGGRFPARRVLRRGDELQLLHARFHEAVEAIAARERRTLAALDEALAALRRAPGDPALEEAARLLEAEARARRDTIAPRG